MSAQAIRYYCRRLDEERLALNRASSLPHRRIHEKMIEHFEQLMQLERFGVDTSDQLPSTIGLARNESEQRPFEDDPPVRRTASS